MATAKRGRVGCEIEPLLRPVDPDAMPADAGNRGALTRWFGAKWCG